MELPRIDNLWKFIGIKNNLAVNSYAENGINYHFVKGNQELIHHFNPKSVYDILNAVNLIHRTLWRKNFFAEGIRN